MISPSPAFDKRNQLFTGKEKDVFHPLVSLPEWQQPRLDQAAGVQRLRPERISRKLDPTQRWRKDSILST